MNQPRPPRLAEWFLESRVWPDERATVLGDSDEQFQQQVQARGALRGALWYWRHAISLVWGLWWWEPQPAWSRGRVMAMDDVRYAVRRLRKQPLTSFVSIATLACAIGAAAATWSLISAVMLHPLQVSEPDRLVEVGYRRNPTSEPTSGFKYPASRRLLEAGLMPMAAWGSIGPATPLLVATNGDPRVRGVRFTAPNFLDVLGLQPALGRFISEDEDRPGEPLVAVLSARFWKSEFNSDRSVIGRTIQVRDQPTRIVGVAPEGFRGLKVGGAPDLFMPLHSIGRVQDYDDLFGDRPPLHWVSLVGRLPDGVTAAQIEGRLNGLKLEWPGSTPDQSFVLTDVETASLSAASRTDLRRFTRLLGSTVALLLAIGSLTVGMLLLMRTEARGGEFAMCLALGASRLRLATGVAIEGVLLATASALLALPVSRLMFTGVKMFRLPGDIRLDVLDLSLDAQVLAGAAGAAIASIVLIAGLASVFALRRDHGDVLRSHAGATPRVTRRRSRAALVTAQVAVTLVLVTGAGLFARSVSRALSLNPDFDTSRVLWGGTGDLSRYGYDGPRSKVFLNELQTRLTQHPAVEAIAFSDSKFGFGTFLVDSQELKIRPGLSLIGIDADYFSAIGLPVLAGRGFTAEDTANARHVAIVSASLAKAIAGDGSVLGRRIANAPKMGYLPAEVEIVGVVSDVRSPNSLEPRGLYVPRTQYSTPVYPGSGGPSLVVRARVDAGAATAAVIETIRAIDPAIYPDPIKTLDARILEGLGPQQFGMTVMAALGSIALLLSVLGTYVIAESMAVLRRREMGIRAALGARGSHLRTLLLSDTFRLVGVGLLLGFGLSWLGAGMIRAFLFQVEPFDPFVTGSVATLIIVLALAVSLRPALAAARIDLARVLRQD